jgi:crotonobetaine/carnitine-CoA ligase
VPIPSFAQDYEKRFGHRLVTLYGSVEAALPIFQSLNQDLLTGSCGRLRQGFQLRIADDADQELPPNTPGNLLLRSDVPNAFFHGYFGDVAHTADAFRGTWFHTGDLARIDEQGNVYFIGRVKDVIRRRGENVNASEVEEEFLQHPDVVIAAAVGIPSLLGEGTEEDVKVAVQVREDSNLDEEELWTWAVKHMARFQVPSVIELVRDIKKTPTGKIEKHGLKLEGGRLFDIRNVLRR